jgi:ADP-heptose:LPS heptosyltransferase
MSNPDLKPYRILVVRPRGIGDTVLVVPALRNLRLAFPKARIEVLVSPHAGDVLSLCPYQDELIFWERHSRPTTKPGVHTGLLATARWLRHRRYDRVYHLRQASSTALLLFLAGIPHRVGFGTEIGRLLMHRHARPPGDRHEVERLLDVLRADGIPIANTYNEAWTEPERDRVVTQHLPPGNRLRVLLCARSNSPLRNWPPERFATVVEWLIREYAAEIHVCDSPANAGHYEKIRRALSPSSSVHWHDWSSALTLRGSFSLICRMHLALGVDTGALHLAAASHVPVISLTLPAYASRYHPWTKHYKQVVAGAGESRPHLDQIDVAAVQAAIDGLAPVFTYQSLFGRSTIESLHGLHAS